MNVNLNSVTASLRGVWDELVERRLWPFALVLVVAIIAIPVVLSNPANETPAPPVPAVTGASSPGAAFQPAVSSEGRKSSQIRKKVRRFARKNPFTPQGLAVGSAASSAGTAEPTATVTGAATSTGDLGGGSASFDTPVTGTGSGDSSGSTGTAPSTTTKTFYYHYTVDVTFGKTGEEDAKTLSEFRALPSSEDPVIVFMGVKNDGKSAVFLVSASATTTGDGKCTPTDTECTFLYMKKGESQTIETVGTDGAVADYTLELRDIAIKRTTGPEAASASDRANASDRRQARSRFRTVVRSVRTLGL